jgi:hypothetical protein
MEGFLPVIVIWAVLCAVLAGYVVFRFVTDRAGDSQRHRLFPLVSHPTDRTFPPKGAWLEWVAYICLLAVPCGLLVALASDIGLISVPWSWSGIVAGVALILGLSLLALAKVVGRRK